LALSDSRLHGVNYLFPLFLCSVPEFISFKGLYFSYQYTCTLLPNLAKPLGDPSNRYVVSGFLSELWVFVFGTI